MAIPSTSFPQPIDYTTYPANAHETSTSFLFYGISEKVYTKIRRPVFKKKLPTNLNSRRIVKKQRQKKMREWLKIKKDIDYFEEQHATIVSYIEKDYINFENCCKMFSEEHQYYDPNIDDCDVYTHDKFTEDIEYYASQIDRNFRFHKILAEVASLKGIFIEPLPYEIFDDLDYMKVKDYW